MPSKSSKQSPTTSKIVIIGGGIGGLSLASALLKRGISDFHYERGEADDVLRQGYHIRILKTGLEAIKDCIEPAIYQQLCDKFTWNSAHAPVLVRPEDAKPLLYMAAYKSFPNSRPISRYALRGAFAKRVEQAGKISYHKQLDRIEVIDENTQRLRVHFKDGSSTEADIVIAADGARSAVRVLTGLPPGEPLTQWINFSYRCKLSPADLARLPPVLRSERVQATAAYGFVNFAALYHHPSTEDLKYYDVVPPAKSNSATDMPEDRDEHLFVSFATPRDVIVDFDSSKSVRHYYEIILAHLEAHPERHHPSYAKTLRLAENNFDSAQASHFYHSTEPPPEWRPRRPTSEKALYAHPRVFFVGDSMHSMPPGRGMGANNAVIDSSLLAPRLADLVQTGKIVDTAAVREANIEYEEEMIPRAFGWVKASIRAFNLDTATWTGSLGLRAFKVILAAGHYYENVAQALHLKGTHEFVV